MSLLDDALERARYAAGGGQRRYRRRRTSSGVRLLPDRGSHICGAAVARKGGRRGVCRRRVDRAGARCYQHRS